MKIKFVIQGETPSKKNSRVTNRKTGRSFPSKHYQEWHTQAIKCLPQTTPIKEPCKINLIFTHGDLRRRDSDNGTSSVMDLLVDGKILEDDNWLIVKEIQIKNEYIKNQASCLVEIETL